MDKNIKEYYKSSHPSHSQGYITPCKRCIKDQQKSKYTGEYHKSRIQNLTLEQQNHRSQQLTKNARKRRIENPTVRIKEAIRARIYNALKSCSITKTNHTVDYLGCESQFYNDYLSSQFEPNWNFENYGALWEIDHIIPLSLFDFSDLEQQKKAFHYTNTRPLAISENRTKSNKIL